MNYILEIFLLGFIIYLSYALYKSNKNQLNAESLLKDKYLLKDQLTQKESEFNQSLENLQLSFSEEQALFKEAKIELNLKEKKLLSDILNLETQLQEEVNAKKKINSQKKSSEVRLGHIAETLAPFLDQFDFDPENCTFLGKPIDYISFADDEISFIEVKSGNSQLNSKQRHIRDQVKAGLVVWKEVRIK